MDGEKIASTIVNVLGVACIAYYNEQLQISIVIDETSLGKTCEAFIG